MIKKRKKTFFKNDRKVKKYIWKIRKLRNTNKSKKKIYIRIKLWIKKVFSFVKKNNENKKPIKFKNGKKINKKVDLNVMRQTKTRWIWKL